MAVELTPAPGPIHGSIKVPGSKSVTNRALVLAAIAGGESLLVGASQSDDTGVLVSALRSLGVGIETRGDAIQVAGVGGTFAPFRGEIDLGLAGTSLRFLLPLCCASEDGDIVLTGNERMRARPLRDLVDALRELGANIDYLGTEGCAPVRVRGHGALSGGQVKVRGDVSSQFLSAVLMAGPLCEESILVDVPGPLVSSSYVELTIAVMRAFGVEVFRTAGAYGVDYRARYHAMGYHVEGDASGATYLWGLAAASGGQVTVDGVGPDSPQGEMQFVRVLERMGCRVRRNASSITVEGPARLRAVEVDMTRMPDAIQTLAVLAACAAGETVITGISTLAHKETDRGVAIVEELGRLGVTASLSRGALRIRGGAVEGGLVQTHGDHRMAMAFAILGAVVPGLSIADPGVVTKSFPEYWDQLRSLGVGLGGQ